MASYVAVVGATVVSAIRDVIRRRWSLASRVLFVGWAFGVVLVLLSEVMDWS